MTCNVTKECQKPATIVYYSVVSGIRCNDAFACAEHDDLIQQRPTKTAPAWVSESQFTFHNLAADAQTS